MKACIQLSTACTILNHTYKCGNFRQGHKFIFLENQNSKKRFQDLLFTAASTWLLLSILNRVAIVSCYLRIYRILPCPRAQRKSLRQTAYRTRVLMLARSSVVKLFHRNLLLFSAKSNWRFYLTFIQQFLFI